MRKETAKYGLCDKTPLFSLTDFTGDIKYLFNFLLKSMNSQNINFG